MESTFNVECFLQSLEDKKPPWECPKCKKVYKSYDGIEHHLLNFDHTAQNAQLTLGSRKSRLKPMKKKRHNKLNERTIEFITSTRDTLTWAEAQRMVEVESEGKIFRLNICEKLDIISDSDIDRNLDHFLSCDDSTDKRNKGSDSELTSFLSKQFKSEKTTSPLNRNGFIRSKDLKSVTLASVQYASEHAPGTNEQISAKVQSALPKPSVRLIPDYKPLTPSVTVQSSEYFRFVDKSLEDVEKEVEYDMDEEDVVWLKLINEERLKDRLTCVTLKQLELLMDRLEKESYFEQARQSQDSSGMQTLKREDAHCCVCNDEECQSFNVMLFCDACNLAVHQDCYGVPYIPKGQWQCQRCLKSPSSPVNCYLCPSRDGAFKQIGDGRWSHVVCALWVPEVAFGSTAYMDPIDGIEEIPPAKWHLTCYICKQKNTGACVQCYKANCDTAFHASCGQQAGLYMKLEPVRRSVRNGGTMAVKKEAYCNAHTPLKALPGRGLKNGMLASKAANRMTNNKLKNANKSLAEKPHTAASYISLDRITAIGRTVSIQKKASFMQRLLCYWTLKRDSRNGLPLLRRHQSHVQAHKSTNPEVDSQQHQIIEQLNYWHRLRHDLERARLLIELIRKREKLKKETIRISQAISEVQLTSFNIYLERVLDKLRSIDEAKIFSQPVKKRDAPQYHKIIEHPMDFSKMSAKIARHEYKEMADFENDFNLIINNCLFYNPRNTTFYKLALQMREQGGAVLRDAMRGVNKIGFDFDTGILLEKAPQKAASKSINKKTKRSVSMGENLEKMHEKSNQLVSTVKVRKVKTEIPSLKRKLSQSNESEARSSRRSATTFVKAKFRRFSADDLDSLATVNETDAVFSDIASTVKISPRLRSPSSIKLPPVRRKRFHSSRPFISPVAPSQSRSKKLRCESVPDGDKLTANSVVVCERLSTNLLNKASVDDIVDNPSINSSGHPSSVKLNPIQPNLPPVRHTCSVNRRTSVLFKKKSRDRLLISTTATPPEKNETTSLCQSVSVKISTPDDHIVKRTRSTSGHCSDEVDTLTKTCDRADGTKVSNEAQLVDTGNSKGENVLPGRLTLKRRESFQLNREGALSEPGSNDCDTVFTAEDVGERSNDTGRSHERSFKKWRSYSVSCANSSRFLSDGETSDNGPDSTSVTHQELFRRQSHVSSAEDELENDNSPLVKPLDLVWAKCRGYPPYPALLIDPKMPRSGFCHNGVPIPVPPRDVLHVGDKRVENGNHGIFLVLFFDAKRTWQWLPRSKLELFGLDSKSDQAKLSEGRRYAIRKNVEAAYKRALLHRSRVRGDITNIDEDERDESHS